MHYSRDEIVFFLGNKYPNISKSFIENVLEFSKLIKVKKKAILIENGKVDTSIYLILKGIIRGYTYIDGEEKTTSLKKEISILGIHESIFNQMPSQKTYQAVEDCDLLVFDNQAYLNYSNYSIEDIFYINKAVLEVLSGAFTRLEDFMTLNPEQRYLQFSRENNDLITRVPQKYLASYLGVTPVSLSRIRAKIQIEKK